MKQRELVDVVRADPAVIPFLGAGMALRAGAPTEDQLTVALSVETGITGDDLKGLVAAAEAAIGLPATREAVASIIARRPLGSDSRLMKLAQWPAERILTTNYDDAVEVAAEEAGLEVRTVLPRSTDAFGWEPGVLKVIHLHGHHSDPSSLILPGATTTALDDDGVFLTQARAILEQGTLLYLGFSFGSGEVHLRGIVRWLQQIDGARQHLLVLPEDGYRDREDDLAELIAVPQVTIATYLADREHSFLESLSSLHARRSEAVGLSADTVDPPPPGYLEPALVTVQPDDDVEGLQGKVRGAEGGWGEPFAAAADLVSLGPALLSGQPGMGKTETLRHLARAYDGDSMVLPASALSSALDRVPDEDGGLGALAMAIAQGRAGREGTGIPDRDALAESSYLILVDDVDLVDADRREEVVSTILRGRERWPHHRWVVAARPCIEVAVLADAGFRHYRIMPSERWGLDYLAKRGVEQERIGWLAGDRAGFGEVMGIPLFAAAAADVLNEDLPPRVPLDLLVTAQKGAARREAVRLGRSGVDWWVWLRRLAVGLELRSRTEARTQELAAVPGHGDFSAEETREILVQASLLVELPDNAAFPRRTLQEALCADTVLGTEDVPRTIEQIAVAVVGGERRLRSDMEFTLDLVFESSDTEVRRRLREIDKGRWAITVPGDAELDEASEAFDHLLGEAETGGHAINMYVAGIRSSLWAVRSLAKAWPELVDQRRVRLLEWVRSEEEHDRFNALWVLASQASDEDPAWLPPMIEDESRRVSLLAAETAAAWQLRAALPHLKSAISRAGPVAQRRRLLRVALDLADGREETLGVVAVLLNDGSLFSDSASEIGAALDLNAYLELLGRRSTNFLVWENLLVGALETAEPHEWTDERVQKLVEAVVAHDGDPKLAADPRLRKVVEGHPLSALAAARLALERRPPAYRGLAMFAGLPDGFLAAPENGTIRKGLEKALDPEELEGWHRNSPVNWYTAAVSRLEDLNADPADVLDPEVHWRIGEMNDRQRDRLTQLTMEHLPPVGAEIYIAHRFDHTREAGLGMGALVAAAQLDLPMENGRFMQLLRRRGDQEVGQAIYGWLRANYSPDLDPEIVEYVEEIDDGWELSSVIAAMPSEALGPRSAIAERLDQLSGEDTGWSNAVGLLVGSQGKDLLLRLLNGRRTPQQRIFLRDGLADLGDTSAQLDYVQDAIRSARAGELQGGPPRWTTGNDDPALLSAFGDLLVALGAKREGSEWWRFGLNKLVASTNTHALGVLDRAGEATGVRMDFARDTLARQLATVAVLNRLPGSIGETAMLLEDEDRAS